SVVYAPNDPNKSELDLDYSNPGNSQICVPLALLGLGVICCLLLGYIYIRRVLKDRHLAKNGQIIEGKLAKIEGHREKGEGSEGYRVTAWYSFAPPTGNSLSGKNSLIRNDLVRRRGFFRWEYDPLPEPGTPVAVIYLDDKHYRML